MVSIQPSVSAVAGGVELGRPVTPRLSVCQYALLTVTHYENASSGSLADPHFLVVFSRDIRDRVSMSDTGSLGQLDSTVLREELGWGSLCKTFLEVNRPLFSRLLGWDF